MNRIHRPTILYKAVTAHVADIPVKEGIFVCKLVHSLILGAYGQRNREKICPFPMLVHVMVVNIAGDCQCILHTCLVKLWTKLIIVAWLKIETKNLSWSDGHRYCKKHFSEDIDRVFLFQYLFFLGERGCAALLYKHMNSHVASSIISRYQSLISSFSFHYSVPI